MFLFLYYPGWLVPRDPGFETKSFQDLGTAKISGVLAQWVTRQQRIQRIQRYQRYQRILRHQRYQRCNVLLRDDRCWAMNVKNVQGSWRMRTATRQRSAGVFAARKANPCLEDARPASGLARLEQIYAAVGIRGNHKYHGICSVKIPLISIISTISIRFLRCVVQISRTSRLRLLRRAKGTRTNKTRKFGYLQGMRCLYSRA